MKLISCGKRAKYKHAQHRYRLQQTGTLLYGETYLQVWELAKSLGANIAFILNLAILLLEGVGECLVASHVPFIFYQIHGLVTAGGCHCRWGSFGLHHVFRCGRRARSGRPAGGAAHLVLHAGSCPGEGEGTAGRWDQHLSGMFRLQQPPSSFRGQRAGQSGRVEHGVRQAAPAEEVAIDGVQPGEEAEVADAIDAAHGAQAITIHAVGGQEELGVVGIVGGDEGWWEVVGRRVARVSTQTFRAVGRVQVGVGVPVILRPGSQRRHGVPWAAVGTGAFEALVGAASCWGTGRRGGWDGGVRDVCRPLHPIGQGSFQKVFRERGPDRVHDPGVEGHLGAPILPEVVRVWSEGWNVRAVAVLSFGGAGVQF